ncbi:MAG: DinB family protein [Gammaproteobacteria bacterium]
MDHLQHCRLMAQYNTWMNERLYEAAARLPAAELDRDRGAFFGSILGTLNHLVVTDLMWLRRFALHRRAGAALAAEIGTPEQPVDVQRFPVGASLAAVVAEDLARLRSMRADIDALTERWIATLEPRDLDEPLAYRNSRGEPFLRSFGALLSHFFNHQTHHRGQATTLLFQAGVDPGVTDLLPSIPALESR